jgi:non-heme chloroperoxidase
VSAGILRNARSRARLAARLLAPAAVLLVAYVVAPEARAQQPGALARAPSAFAAARFLQVEGAGGVPLNVVEAGDPSRPAVLFIHGFRQTYLAWTAQFGSDLAQRCHIVAFDLRGHGNSGQPWQAEAYDHSQPWGEDVARVIKATGLVKPLIVGWSFGGNVAMDYVRHYPDAPVAGFLLAGTGAGMLSFPPPPPNAPPRPVTSPDLELNIAAVDASAGMLFQKSLDPVLRARFTAAAMRTSPFVDRAIAARAGTTNQDLIARLHAPVTLVIGGQDPIVRPEMAARVRALWPQARYIAFPDSGHAPFLDEPARFDALLDEMQCGGPSR